MFLFLQDHHWLIGLINCLLYPPALLEITELFVRNFTLSFIHYYYYFFFVRQELKKKKKKKKALGGASKEKSKRINQNWRSCVENPYSLISFLCDAFASDLYWQEFWMGDEIYAWKRYEQTEMQVAVSY